MIGINNGHIRKTAQTVTINAHITSPRKNDNIILSIAISTSNIPFIMLPPQ